MISAISITNKMECMFGMGDLDSASLSTDTDALLERELLGAVELWTSVGRGTKPCGMKYCTVEAFCGYIH